MKCPKCGYLGFESSDRCRNCGYEFALVTGLPPAFDLPLLPPDSEPLIPDADAPSVRPSVDLDRLIGDPAEAAEDLPLFDEGTPMVVTPSRPRTPLGVRRPTPEIPRARITTPRIQEKTLFEPPAALSPLRVDRVTVASPISRVTAALVDALILFSLDGAVLYFTLRLCGLAASEVLALPIVPLIGFLLLLNGGYCVAFTAVGGQSIGKMALGIKVVGDEDRPVPFGRAAIRTLAYAVSALPLGAGFLPAIVGVNRLALHDRLAHTRVIRPSV